MSTTYTKINTLYRRYQKLGDLCNNPKWRKFQNVIIKGCFSDPAFEYLYNCKWEGYSKIDGTNSKIIFYPSTGKVEVGGKTDKASSQHGQFEMLQEIGDRIKPMLCEMFPKESAVFTPIKDGNKVVLVDTDNNPMVTDHEGRYNVGIDFEESPVYIYGEYFGEGIQKCGKRYIEKGNDFMVFDICQQGWWLPSDMRNEYCSKLGLKTVPFIGIGTLSEFEDMVTKGFSTKMEGAADPTLIEEGIVARPIIPIKDCRGNRVIVKIKNCDYAKWNEVKKDFSDEELFEFNRWYNENVEKIF